jgi:hypothetical protein
MITLVIKKKIPTLKLEVLDILIPFFKQYGLTPIHLGPTLWPYSNPIVSHASSITFSIDYDQSNALPSTIPSSITSL